MSDKEFKEPSIKILTKPESGKEKLRENTNKEIKVGKNRRNE